MLETSYQINECVFHTTETQISFSTQSGTKSEDIFYLPTALVTYSVTLVMLMFAHIHEFQSILTSFLRTAGLTIIFIPRISCKLEIQVGEYLEGVLDCKRSQCSGCCILSFR